MKNDVLIVMAMREESQGLFEQAGIPVLYTGIGKVNAAYHLTRALGQKAHPKLVLNFGTAGSFVHPAQSLVECTRFVQRDMDASPLGIPVGTTPFDELPNIIEFPKVLPHLLDGTCGSGDSFATSVPPVKCDVVDMEAYALARVCKLEKINFLSIKFVTDGSDGNAHNDWASNLPKAAAAFVKQYHELLARF